MMVMLLPLVAIFFSQSNEDDFWRIEETIKTAKSVSLQVRKESTITEGGKVHSIKWSGSVLLKEGNKLNVSLTEADAPNSPLQIICNHKDILVRDVDSTVLKGQAVDGLSNGVRLAISRGQVDFWLADAAKRIKEGNNQSVDWKARFKVANIRVGEPDSNLKTLTYDVKSSDDTIHFRVWYDSETYKPIKRSYEYKKDQLSAKGVEFYGSLTLNAEIPDSKFDIPSK